MKILLSAYACQPNQGSEPGIGWSWAMQLAGNHEVWVLTRRENAEVIERELLKCPVANLHFEYFDLPRPLRMIVPQRRLRQLHYYFWQRCMAPRVRELLARIPFDLVHHVTYVRYWMPAIGCHLPADGPVFIWGPVGGGERSPPGLRGMLGFRGRAIERLRSIAQWLGEHDPLLRRTARRAAVAFASTNETAARCLALGARRVEVLTCNGMPVDELAECLAIVEPPENPFRIVSMGRLLYWKGFELGLRAFALANIPGSQYTIVGNGPERANLQAVARELGIADRVTLTGWLPRSEAIKALRSSHVLLHPSLHDSGGGVLLEAMASLKVPVCLDCGGPSVLVSSETGFKISPDRPETTITGLAAALLKLSGDSPFRQQMGSAGRQRAGREFGWDERYERMNEIYQQMTNGG